MQGTSETIIVSKPTYVDLIAEADKYGAQGFEAFQFERDMPGPGGTVLALFMRRISMPEMVDLMAANSPAPETAPAQDPNVIPDPGASSTPIASATDVATAAGIPPAGVEHPLVHAGVPPVLVDEINAIAQIEGVNPKQWVIHALQMFLKVSWDKLEQDGKVQVLPDGTRTLKQ